MTCVALLNVGPPGYGAFVQLRKSILRIPRFVASLLMLLAAIALTPTAMAGAQEAAIDSASMALEVADVDADGCVLSSDNANGERPADGQHCPACCLHHHGPNGLVGDVFTAISMAPSRQSWNEWQPTSLRQAPALVLIQPPRA